MLAYVYIHTHTHTYVDIDVDVDVDIDIDKEKKLYFLVRERFFFSSQGMYIFFATSPKVPPDFSLVIHVKSMYCH